jgi:hypothetical protein
MGTRAALVAVGALALSVFGVSAASAATLMVCESGPPKCGYSSISKAVDAAKSGDTIKIEAGNYREGSPLTPDKDLTLQGVPGATTILAQHGGEQYQAEIRGKIAVTITGITFLGAEGVHNENATLTVNNCVFSNNDSIDGPGGGIKNVQGAVNVTNSTIRHNFAVRGGGGIYTEGGSLTVSNSTVSENGVFNRSGGGGIRNVEGTVSVSNSTITDNKSEGAGGGIYTEGGSMTVSNSTVSENAAEGGAGISGEGGGIWASGTLAVSDTTVSTNTAERGSVNEAPTRGGGIFAAGPAHLSNAKIIGNQVEGYGGGIFNGGTMTIRKTTVSENTAKQVGSNYTATGGGIFNEGTLTGSHDMITGNTPNGLRNILGGTEKLKHSEVQSP